MHVSFVDAHLYDDEIDRMLVEVRAQRRHQRQVSLARKTHMEGDTAQRKGNCTQHGTRDGTSALFTSTLERQRLLEEVQRCTRPVPRTSFLEAALPCSITALAISSPPDPPLQLEGVQDAAAHPSAAEATIKRLQRELRRARDENALMRREMYGVLCKIGKYIDQLRGTGECCSPDGAVMRDITSFHTHVGDSASPPPPTSVWELQRRGILRLMPEEEAILRNIKDAIDSCKQHYNDMQRWYDEHGTVTMLTQDSSVRDDAEVQLQVLNEK